MASLNKLLQLSIKQKITDKQFLSLFDQLIKLQPLDPEAFTNLLEDSINENYLILLAIKSDLFWESVPKLPLNQQVRLLNKLKSKISLIKDIESFLKLFTSYCNYVINENNEDLVNGIMFNWDILINSYSIKDYPIVRLFMDKFSVFLSVNNYSKQLEYCNTKFKTNFRTLKKSNIKKLKLNVKLKSYQNYELLKIFYWFNQFFVEFHVPNNDIIFTQFNSFFGVFTANNSFDPEATFTKLIISTFNGIIYCEKTKRSNIHWVNFVYSRLPKLITLYKLDNLDDMLGKVFDEIKLVDLLIHEQNFIKSLIFNKVLSIKSIHKFPEMKFNQQNLIHEMSNINSVGSFRDALTDKLYNVNCEFISFEESQLIVYFNEVIDKLAFSMAKQIELSCTLQDLINTLIVEASFEKLNRIILLILYNKKLFNMFLFNMTDYNVIYNLISLVDGDAFDNADDNDSFQETYCYFGNLLLFLTKVSRIINLQFDIKNSFFLGYLNNVSLNYYNLTNFTDSANKTNDETNTLQESYKSLMSDWIQSLFIDSDGLSDDILKSINIKQIHQLIPLIYQQAISSVINNNIDFKILANGLDYLSQNFLIMCTHSIVSWLITRISLKNKYLSTYLEVLQEIVQLIEKVSKDSNNETKLTADILLESITHSLSILPLLKVNVNFIDIELEESRKLVLLTSEIVNFETFEDNLVKIFNGNGHNADFPLIDFYISTHPHIVEDLLINLNNYQFKFANENFKYVIDFVIFINLIKAVKSADDRDFWMRTLNTKRNHHRYKSLVIGSSVLEWHYSSILNDRRNHQLLESVSVDYGMKQCQRFANGLSDFYLVWCRYGDNEAFKAISLVHEKLVNDLKSFPL